MNNYKSQKKRLYFQPTTGLEETVKLKLRKIHKAEKAVVFIEKCLEHVVQPKFCQLPNALKPHLSKDEIFTIQQRNLKTELQNKKFTSHFKKRLRHIYIRF